MGNIFLFFFPKAKVVPFGKDDLALVSPGNDEIESSCKIDLWFSSHGGIYCYSTVLPIVNYLWPFPLGYFIAVEYVMSQGQDRGEGIKTTQRMMERLEIRNDDLEAGAYFDLLNPQTSS